VGSLRAGGGGLQCVDSWQLLCRCLAVTISLDMDALRDNCRGGGYGWRRSRVFKGILKLGRWVRQRELGRWVRQREYVRGLSRQEGLVCSGEYVDAAFNHTHPSFHCPRCKCAASTQGVGPYWRVHTSGEVVVAETLFACWL